MAKRLGYNSFLRRLDSENHSKPLIFHEKSSNFHGLPCQNLLSAADVLTAASQCHLIVRSASKFAIEAVYHFFIRDGLSEKL